MNTNELKDKFEHDFCGLSFVLHKKPECAEAGVYNNLNTQWAWEGFQSGYANGYARAMREMAEMEPACIILRNTAGQISQRGADGDYFDMSKYVGQKLIPRPTIKGE